MNILNTVLLVIGNQIYSTMISRIWHGWTTIENAPKYEHLLLTEIFPSIEMMNVNGYLGIRLMKRLIDEEVEFITIMEFENLDSVKQFAGVNYKKSYVPDKAQELLSRHDNESHHYEMSNLK